MQERIDLRGFIFRPGSAASAEKPILHIRNMTAQTKNKWNEIFLSCSTKGPATGHTARRFEYDGSKPHHEIPQATEKTHPRRAKYKIVTQQSSAPEPSATSLIPPCKTVQQTISSVPTAFDSSVPLLRPAV